MLTPVLLVAGQCDTDAVVDALLAEPGTLAVTHRLDGHVVRRTVTTVQRGVRVSAGTALELTGCCVSCTTRADLLAALPTWGTRSDVHRIVVALAPWQEPEPVCAAIVADHRAARAVAIDAVVTCIDNDRWLTQSLGETDLPDGRTVAQVTVAQAEFADVIVATGDEQGPDAMTAAVLARLCPLAETVPVARRVPDALRALPSGARRGRASRPFDPLLHGQPPLTPDGEVRLLGFGAQRPFHPQRLHEAIDVLLDGVIRTRGRLWLANRPEHAMYLESAGGGLLFTRAGRWLAAMDTSQACYADPERRLMAQLIWHPEHGDRRTDLTVLVCGADPGEIEDALTGALLTDTEMAEPARWAQFADPFGDWHADPCADEGADDADSDVIVPGAGSPGRRGGWES